ncbi:MAG TPA: hypothetical protein ENJ46_01605 [Hellea balneolensis]|uniref:Uncharacterized protein n=1 Tax=Hellea balneolensis TaxID=287478 RepID=A0A7C3G4S7_9PROT|nr:hypothetical protein [Hellea balneolensis]
MSYGILFSLNSNAWAHRKKILLSTIEWNAHTHTLEVTHRFHLHDAEVALSQLGKLDKPDLTPLRARANLALHTYEQFKISTLEHDPLELDIIGVEIDGSYVFVYEEIALKQPPQGLIVENEILHDVYLDQINTVNIAISDHVKTLTFIAGDNPKKVLA